MMKHYDTQFISFSAGCKNKKMKLDKIPAQRESLNLSQWYKIIKIERNKQTKQQVTAHTY